MRIPPFARLSRRATSARVVVCLLSIGTLPVALDLATPAAAAGSHHAGSHHAGSHHAGSRPARSKPKRRIATAPTAGVHAPSGPRTVRGAKPRTVAAAPAPAAAKTVPVAHDGRPKDRAGRWVELHAPGADRRMSPEQRATLLPWIREYQLGEDGGVWVLLAPGAPPALGG